MSTLAEKAQLVIICSVTVLDPCKLVPETKALMYVWANSASRLQASTSSGRVATTAS